MKNILQEIVANKIKEVERNKQLVPMSQLEAGLLNAGPVRDFAEAIKSGLGKIPAVIAEIKKASPSKGVIRSNFNPVEIARSYQCGGAAAVSVLTDQQYFQGRLEYVQLVKRNVNVPVLRKDFIVNDYQIYESRTAGADAILLIVAALEEIQLKRYLTIADSLSLHCLVEVHNAQEAMTALTSGAKIIGINNRNLKTFETSLETSYSLAEIILNHLSNVTLVSESGIFTNQDLRQLGSCGVDAVLVGEALMRADDVESELKRLIG